MQVEMQMNSWCLVPSSARGMHDIVLKTMTASLVVNSASHLATAPVLLGRFLPKHG